MELTLGLHLTQLLILLNALATPVRGISVLSRVINPIKTLPPAQEMAAPEISRKVFVLDTCRLDQLQDLLFFFPMAKRLVPALNRILVEKIVPPSKTNAGILLPEKTAKVLPSLV